MKVTAKKLKIAINTLLLASFLGAGGYLFFFLANYFYPAIAGSQTIYLLQKNMAVENINLKKFNDLLNNISAKTAASPNQAEINNPFK